VEFWDCRSSPVFADGYANVKAPTSGVVEDVDVHLVEGGRIIGRAVDSIGQAATGVYVAVYSGAHLHGVSQVYFPEHMVRTDAQGNFVLSGLSSAEQRLTFTLCPANSYSMETCPGSRYEAEWYKDRSGATGGYGEYDQADTISVTLGATTDIGSVTLSIAPVPSPSAT
jgi:hypothetical protein